MYLHLGNDTVIKHEDILGIFDLDTSTVSKHTRDYLAKAEKNGEVVNVSMELPKAFIISSEKKKKNKKVYISQLSSSTLLKRVKMSW